VPDLLLSVSTLTLLLAVRPDRSARSMRAVRS